MAHLDGESVASSEDVLSQVLEAVTMRRGTPDRRGRGTVTLIALRTLDRHAYERIRSFQSALRDRLRINSVVVGGGYGCTKITIKVIELESDDPNEIDRVVSQVLTGQTFRDEARAVPFDVAVLDDPYARRDLRTDRVERGPVLIIAKEVTMGDKGDTYNISKGAVGGRHVNITNFTQVWNEWSDAKEAPSLDALAEELGRLRKELKKGDNSPEQDAAAGAVAQAEIEAKKQNGSRVLEALAGAGKWVLETAQRIGVELAVQALKKSMGIPG